MAETANKKDFIELKYTGYANGEIFDSNIEEDLKRINPKAKPEKIIIAVGQDMVMKGLDKALTKSDREVKAGLVEVYSHNGKVGVLVELLCETDFVAKTDDFKNLAHELSLQIASMNPSSMEELLSQEYIRDATMTVDQLIKSAVGKLGENIQVGRFERIALGE